MHSLNLKLSPGEDLRLSIEKTAKDGNHTGFVVGIVGNLAKASFQCPGRANPTVLEGNLEIITLNGTFSNDRVHLHLSLSDGNCQVWGGHLEPGTLILKGADILLCLLKNDQSLPKRLNNTISNYKYRIEIAIIPDCAWSNRAIRLLRSYSIPHNVHNIKDDESFLLLKQKTGLSSFPQIFIDGDFIGGYDALNELHNNGKLKQFV